MLDEEAIIKTLWTKLSRKGKDPFDDDVMWVRNSSGKLVISKIDMLVTSTDVPEGMSTAQIAKKAVVSCISDFAAKGLKPSFCLVSLGLPKRLANAEFISDLAAGFAAAQKEYNVKILGGDVNETKFDGVIDCAGVGFADRIVLRRGARKGDLIGVSGRFGYQAAGLLILKGKARSETKSFRRKAIRSVFNPKARLGFGISVPRYISSSIDSSDGLAISLHHLAEASGVNFELDYLTTDYQLDRFASINGIDVNDLILFGGEEYELVFTFPPKYRGRLSKEGMITIGKVVETKARSKPRVLYRLKPVPKKGWIHFQRSNLN